MAHRFSPKVAVPKEPKTTDDKEPAAFHVKELAEKDYETVVVGGALPVVLDFYATESKPNDDLAPRLAAVAKTFAGKVSFVRVLHKDAPALAAKLNVTASPTLLFFKAGQEKGARLTGEEIARTAVKASVEALLA